MEFYKFRLGALTFRNDTSTKHGVPSSRLFLLFSPLGERNDRRFAESRLRRLRPKRLKYEISASGKRECDELKKKIFFWSIRGFAVILSVCIREIEIQEKNRKRNLEKNVLEFEFSFVYFNKK